MIPLKPVKEIREPESVAVEEWHEKMPIHERLANHNCFFLISTSCGALGCKKTTEHGEAKELKMKEV